VHLNPRFGEVPIATITPVDVQGAVNEWSQRLAARTVRRQYGTLRAILRYAVNADFIARSPCREINLPALTQQRRHVVTADELAALADKLGSAGLMAYVATMGGLRWGEVASLRVRSLNLLGGTLAVTETVTRGAKGRPAVGEPKSEAGRRTLASRRGWSSSCPRILPGLG
jgi:integrase